MATMPNPFGVPPARSSQPYPLGYAGPAVPAVLVRFFNTVYAWMAVGLGLTALVALWISGRPDLLQRVFNWPVLLGLLVVELLLVGVISMAVRRISATTATVLFAAYAALNGLTLGGLFLVYTKASLASTFFVTAGTFAAMSIFGLVTKRNLTALGSLLFMALIGLILASVVNLFIASSALYWITTYAGVLIFVGLTAYDTQKLKQIAYATSEDPAMASRLAITGALVLYLDFLNLFLFLLRLIGQHRE